MKEDPRDAVFTCCWLRLAQGFPRSDIDIPAVRSDRHRLAGEGVDLKRVHLMIWVLL